MIGTSHTRRHPWPAAIGALALALLPAGPARAATILWSTPAAISGDADVSTTGLLLYAYNIGAQFVQEATVNEVLFAPFPVPALSSGAVTVGDVTLEVSPEFYSDSATSGSGAPPFNGLSSSYQSLLGSQVSASVNNSSLTLTLGGLTAGQAYMVQFWSNDSGALFNRWGGTIYTSGNTVVLDNSVQNHLGGTGEWVTGSFTASGDTQVVTVNSTTLTQDFPVMNAFQVRVVPEPSAALLLLCGAALLRRRRAPR